jgi:hypothetical protein
MGGGVVAAAAAGRAGCKPKVPTGLVLKLLLVVVGAAVLAVLNVCCRGECPAFTSLAAPVLLLGLLVWEPVTVLRARWTCALSTTASSSSFSASHICCATLFTLAADDDDREDENACDDDDDEGVVAVAEVADTDEAKLEPLANGAVAVAARRIPPRLPPRLPPEGAALSRWASVAWSFSTIFLSFALSRTFFLSVFFLFVSVLVRFRFSSTFGAIEPLRLLGGTQSSSLSLSPSPSSSLDASSSFASSSSSCSSSS